MANGFMLPGGGAVSGDAFTARRLYIHSQTGQQGSRTNPTKAGCLYVFCAAVVDGGKASPSFTGAHCLFYEAAYNNGYFSGTGVEVWAADTDGSVTVNGDICLLWELTPDA